MHEQILDLIQSSNFSLQRFKEDRVRLEVPTRPRLAALPIIIKQNKHLEQAHLIIATPFVSAIDECRYTADLLASVIGGGTSSRLWQKIREERGLAYSVGASAVMYQDCGLFSIFAGIRLSRSAKLSISRSLKCAK